MPPLKPKARQRPMSKAELRAEGMQALAQTSKPIMKLPMKVKRQCLPAGLEVMHELQLAPLALRAAFLCGGVRVSLLSQEPLRPTSDGVGTKTNLRPRSAMSCSPVPSWRPPHCLNL